MAVKRQEQKLGRKLTKQEVAHVVHQTRPKKLKGATDEQVRRQQLGEIGFFEKRALRKVVAAADGQSQDFAQRVGHESQAVDHGIAHVFERTLGRAAAQDSGSRLGQRLRPTGPGTAKESAGGRSDLVRVGSEFSTRDILTKELSLIRTVNAGIDAVAPDHRRLRTAVPSRPGPAQGPGACADQPGPVHRLPRPGRFGQKHGPGRTGTRVSAAGVSRPCSAPRPLPLPTRCARDV